MGKNFGKNISKNLKGKYNQKLFDHAKQSATDTLKTSSKRVIQKTADATCWLLLQLLIQLWKSQETHHRLIPKKSTNEHDKEMPKGSYIFPEERQKIVDDLRLI